MKERVTVHALAIFAAVVRCGGPSKAAKAPGVDLSQPAISNQIKYLEQRYGPLFQKDTRSNWGLTELGAVLYAHAQQVLTVVDELEAEMADGRKGWEQALRIGASVTIGEQLLPEYLGRFHAQHRDVALQVRIGNTDEITEDVVGRPNPKLDFAIVGKAATQSGIRSYPIIPDRIEPFVAAAPSDPALRELLDRAVVEPKDLSGYPFVLREKGSATLARALECLREVGCNPQHVLELSSNEAVKAAVAQGLGIGLLSSYAIRTELREGVLRLLPVTPWGCDRTHWLIWRHDRPLIGAARDFLRELGSAFPEIDALLKGASQRIG